MKLIQCRGDVPMSALIVSIPFIKQFMELGINGLKQLSPLCNKGDFEMTMNLFEIKRLNYQL